MRTRFLFVMDPLDTILPDKDTTFVLMLETLRRGHEVYYAGIGDLYLRSAEPFVNARRAIVERATPHFALLEVCNAPLSNFAAIFMRKDPPVDQAYLFATLLLSFADRRQTLLVNDPAALRDANEKLFALRFPSLIPPTLVTNSVGRLRDFLTELGGRMIIKPLDGCGGSGVFLVDQADRNTASLFETSTANGTRMIVAQQYIDAVRDGDKRIILLDGQPIGAVLRVPAANDHRGNIHVGGACRAAPLTTRDVEICGELRPALRALGLIFVGIDVIGEYLTEVNVTSPTGIQEIDSLNKGDLAGEVLNWVDANLPS